MYEYCNLRSRVSGFKSKPCTSHCSSKPHNLPVNVIGWTLHHPLHDVSGKESHKGPIQLWKCPKNKRYLPAIGEKITDSSNSIPGQLTDEEPFLLLLHVQLEPVPVRIANNELENQADFIIPAGDWLVQESTIPRIGFSVSLYGHQAQCVVLRSEMLTVARYLSLKTCTALLTLSASSITGKSRHGVTSSL